MENLARLAFVESNIGNLENYIKLLYELLNLVNSILENPHDHEWKTIRNDFIISHYKTEGFEDFLKYVGFVKVNNQYVYPRENTFSTLRLAHVAIQRKIFLCGGKQFASLVKKTIKNPSLKPAQVLKTNNGFLLKLESLFNDVLKYENEELLQLARQHIPVSLLQVKAIDSIRKQQADIKAGRYEGPETPFDMALLHELVGWFKHEFFAWTDKPPCPACNGNTRHLHNTTHTTTTETCNMEVYQCVSCGSRVTFPRYNDPKTLLSTRRGRCGEWANCFTLLCRALRYDARFVYDTTDHVWCEVYDYDTKTWIHVDPCEAKIDSPLMYSHGWGKKLSYIIAFSRDDIQDVTWRYTTDHKEVLKRRQLCLESELISSILALRSRRQRQVSEPRRKYLARRTLEELAQMMTERKPQDYERHGRLTGSAEWRRGRGEMGATRKHTFKLDNTGSFNIGYYPSKDEYRVSSDYEPNVIDTWVAGAFHCDNIARKVEHDWKMVYLARQDSSRPGAVSWRFEAAESLECSSMAVRATAAVFEGATVQWTVSFDDEAPADANFGETPNIDRTFARRFKSAQVTAQLSGGSGQLAWQHAQLFRAPNTAADAGLHLQITVDKLA